ncbi:hypothetical protein [Cellulomonas xiejunii]|uniref:Uncharacterized protein n=1 Tax=Cellulomonas xiejunii TaxID=2968083 RepID=A0ABY5KTF5_9CELL|nr:hypothetical protein [Cellulomonas xiejunii]MCC2323452.1 hypothetical protein [Cellulomonas xiejunii]UUI71618.1 hypothetical protein NP048_17790 [Cellulomonas xiejunii]
MRGPAVTVEDPVRRWVADAVAALRAGTSYVDQIDLDDLLGTAYDVRTAVPTGLEVLAAAHATLADVPDVAPRLAVPLAESPTLDARAPALDDVETLHDTFHPPGLYVVRRNLEHLTGGWEEYRVGYDRVVRDLGDGLRVEASYSCWRDEAERANGWSFARTLWFDVRREGDEGAGCP